jgi:hypothetical protein
VKLPFLQKESNWPIISEMKEKTVGLSPDDELKEHCVDEIFDSVAANDKALFRQALSNLIRLIQQETGEQHAS